MPVQLFLRGAGGVRPPGLVVLCFFANVAEFFLRKISVSHAGSFSVEPALARLHKRPESRSFSLRLKPAPMAPFLEDGPGNLSRYFFLHTSEIG